MPRGDCLASQAAVRIGGSDYIGHCCHARFVEVSYDWSNLAKSFSQLFTSIFPPEELDNFVFFFFSNSFRAMQEVGRCVCTDLSFRDNLVATDNFIEINEKYSIFCMLRCGIPIHDDIDVFYERHFRSHIRDLSVAVMKVRGCTKTGQAGS